MLKSFFVESGEEISHRKIRKTAHDSYHSVSFEFVNEKKMKDSIPENYSVCALETAENSENIFKTNMPERIALIVGNEKSGIESYIIEQCEQIMHIPLTGNCT